MSERQPIGLSVPYRKPAGGMKCPICGAATDVKETRTKENNMVYRKRICFNDHKFTTKEIPVPQDLIDEEMQAVKAKRLANLKRGK
jgi:transcriptional regulator NrdR family protein